MEPADAAGEDGFPIEITGLELRGGFIGAVVEDYRRAHALLLEDGWELNRKRVQRLWREEGLRVPRRRRKRQRLGPTEADRGRLGVARDLGYEFSDVLSLLALDDIRGHRSVAQADRAVVAADLSLQATVGDRVKGQ